jgi:putative addiction module component (TIGR02574 family)
MSSVLMRLTEEALALPEEERVVLAERIFDSLNGQERPEINRSWAEEAERRIAAYERGEIQGIPAEEVLRSLAEEETQ